MFIHSVALAGCLQFSLLPSTIIFPPFSPLGHKYVMPYSTRNYILLFIQTYDT